MSILQEDEAIFVARLIIYMQDFSTVKAVEFSGRGDTVCPDIFGVKVIADLQIARQLFRYGNLVETVAGWSDNCADLFFASSE